MPKAVMTHYNTNITPIQQDLMAEMIVDMGMVSIEEPLMASSIVEQALQQASSTKISISASDMRIYPSKTKMRFTFN